jgi:hypothetical protein
VAKGKRLHVAGIASLASRCNRVRFGFPAMPSDKEYEERISKCSRRGVLALWRQVEARDTPGWDAGKACEYCILRAFQLEKATVFWPYHVYDRHDRSLELEQMDGAILVNGRYYILSVKDEADPLNIDPIAKLRNQLLRRPWGVVGLLFSRSGFTRQALAEARLTANPPVLLWVGEEIDAALRSRTMVRSLEAKYRVAVTHGRFDYNSIEPPSGL